MTEGSGEVRELPKGWCWIELEEISDFKNGINFKKEQKGGQGILTIDVLNMYSQGTAVVLDKLYRVDIKVDQERTLKYGDILFVRSSVKREGVGWAALFKESSEPITFCGFIIRARILSTEINPEYLIYYLRTHSAREKIVASSNQVTITNINQNALGKVRIPLCSAREQERIVEKIEELFSDLEQGIKSLTTAQKQLRVYRQAVLKWAFEGKLTEEWRKQHSSTLKTGKALLAQIKAERESRYQQQVAEWEEKVREWEAIGKAGKKPTKPQKLKELLPLTKSELAELPEIPDNWRWVKLGSMSTSIRIGPFGSLLHKSDYVSNQIPAINPSHIKNLKIIPDLNQTITPEKFAELGSYALQEGDIIMGRRGEMGRCAVVTQKENEYLCGTGSLLIRLVDILDSYFYCLILSSRRVKTYLENASIGTTMQNLNEDILHDVPIPLCNPDEQDKILEEIESRLSICDQLEATIIENLQKAEALRQSILKQAFEGKLVPQDPNDEPAEKLLERIKAERQVNGNTGKKSKPSHQQLILQEL